MFFPLPTQQAKGGRTKLRLLEMQSRHSEVSGRLPKAEDRQSRALQKWISTNRDMGTK